ncbi:unnamed protein product [Trichogramma brassicae]|uniref:Uncharacterized protein n=1 Tax=Trichogramma brassicae TaxID=86971 RepID=A0A6H5I9E8_9HYME|nr:unnamed protein product [Trichogramma brassicae]
MSLVLVQPHREIHGHGLRSYFGSQIFYFAGLLLSACLAPYSSSSSHRCRRPSARAYTQPKKFYQQWPIYLMRIDSRAIETIFDCARTCDVLMFCTSKRRSSAYTNTASPVHDMRSPLPPSRPNYFTSIIYNGIRAWIFHVHIYSSSQCTGIACACPRNHVKPIVRLFFRPTGILALPGALLRRCQTREKKKNTDDFKKRQINEKYDIDIGSCHSSEDEKKIHQQHAVGAAAAAAAASKTSRKMPSTQARTMRSRIHLEYSIERERRKSREAFASREERDVESATHRGTNNLKIAMLPGGRTYIRLIPDERYGKKHGVVRLRFESSV